MEQLVMLEKDLHVIMPQESDIRLCDMAIREISRFAVDIVDRLEADVHLKRFVHANCSVISSSFQSVKYSLEGCQLRYQKQILLLEKKKALF